MYSNLEVIFLGALVLIMAYYTIKFVLDKPETFKFFAMVVNMPLYIVTFISLVLMLIMPLSSGYFLMVILFKRMLILLLIAEISLQAFYIQINRSNRKKEVQTIQLSQGR